MKSGYIYLHRKIQDNFLWKERRIFSKAEAWIDILMEARWEEESKEVTVGSKTYLLNRGECLYSLETWAGRWKWSKSKVQRFFNLLRDRYAIRTQSDTQTTRLIVCNYSEYQKTIYANGTQTDTQTSHNLISKEVKKEKDIVPSEDFETFWKQYPARGEPPKKTQKETAMKAYISATKDKSFPGLTVLLNLLEQEKRSEQWRKPKYIPMAATWLHGKPWKDEPAQTQTGSILDSFNADEWDIKHAD